MAEKYRVFVGTYTRILPHSRGACGKGIYSYVLDMADGHLSYEGVTTGMDSPSFLAIAGDRLYATGEVGEWPEGMVSAYSINHETGALTYLNIQPTGGAAAAYVAASGGHVFVANYMGPDGLAMFPTRGDGSLAPAAQIVRHRGSGPNAGRQEAPHAHCAVPDPSGRYVCVADLGIDQIVVYRIEGDRLAEHSRVSVNPGAGPRHISFHPNGRFAYVSEELTSTISALAWNDGVFTRLQTLSTVPADVPQGLSNPSDIHAHPNGRFVYEANRFYDSIAIFAIDQGTGMLTFVGAQPTGGKTPRNFAIDPTGAVMLVGNQDSDSINTFWINPETGALTPTGFAAHAPTPVCLKLTRVNS
jgi:6-phosphogluconolactonase